MVNREAYRTGSPIDEIDTLDSNLGELFLPIVNQAHVAAILVRATGNQYHADIFLHGRIRSVEPLKISHLVLLGLETLGPDLIGHRRDLVILWIRHLSLRPNKFPFQGESLQ